MAIFVTPRYEVAQAVAAIWGLKLGNGTMTDVLSLIGPGKYSAAEVVSAAFANSFAGASDAAVATAYVANLGITGAEAAGAVALVEDMLAENPGDRAGALLNLTKAFSALAGNPAAGVTGTLATAFNNKVGAAVSYSQVAGSADAALGDVPASTSFNLTTGQDNLTGSAGNDIFYGYVFDNQNTFQSGDFIDGGAGVDTLDVTMGVSSAFAVLARTVNVENVYIRSQSNNADGNGGDNNVAARPVIPHDLSRNDNTVDAELMRGVKEWWSSNSRADLVIEDVRILDNEITKDITIGWADADPSSIVDGIADKVDYEVYFSPESLRKQGDTTSNAIQLTVGNQIEVEDFNPLAPIDNLPYDYVQFLVDGESVILDLNSAGIDDDETYNDLWQTFQDAFAAAKASAEYGALLADVTITRIVGGNTFFSRDGQLRSADVYEVVKGSGAITPADIGWYADQGLPSNNAFSARVIQGAAVTTSDLITSTIVLDNVGRESEAGTLVVGSMSTRTGVERFDIEVRNNDHTSGAYTWSGSWISSAMSTNNFLREVLAHNSEEGIASPDYLYIGTGMDESNNNLTSIRQTFLSTQWTEAGYAKYVKAVDAALLNTDGLTDVRLFDASAMEGKVKVGASITSASVQKYQDLVDTDPSDGIEDVTFQYLLGSNNDSINLRISPDVVGSWAPVGRHDFGFEINGNDGDDHIVVTVDYGGEDGGDEHWYTNQKINANIRIEGGNGNDTIRTPGAGDKEISGGAGNDTIYSDNTGDRFTWAYNSTNANYFDLESHQPAVVMAVNAHLTVDFRGFTKTVVIGNSQGSTTNVRITDLTVNQAIKDAINNDPVLSKLLLAEDGPGRTLIVTSLIDGTSLTGQAGDLSGLLDITFSNRALTPSQANIATLSLFNPATTIWLERYTDDNVTTPELGAGKVLFTGSQSTTTADNVIEGGTGDDVIVLSTTGYLNNVSTDQLWGSNETVVYTGFNNGRDTIVNFDTTMVAPGTPIYNNIAPVLERITVRFSNSDGDPAAQTIIFDGDTVTLPAPAVQGIIPAFEVAYAFATQFGTANWVVVGGGTGAANDVTVTLERVVAGALTDVVAADFTGTYFSAGAGTATVTTTQQGADAQTWGTASTFNVIFDIAATAADAAGAFTFDGVTVNYAEGAGALSLADALLAASFPNWTTAALGVGGVTFTARDFSARPIGLDADFDLATNNIVGLIAGVVGTDTVGSPTVTISPGGPGRGFDYLDFSAYDPAGVVVNGAVLVDVAGDAYTVMSAAPSGQTYSYVRMTESATNEGEYRIELVTVDSVASTADVVQLIGVADFGDTAEVNFVAENFIV